MKPNYTVSIQAGLRSILLSAAVVLGASTALAQNVLLDFSTNSIFATNGLAGMWNWWGGASKVFYFDATNDAGNDPTSGSIKIEVTWPTGPLSDYQYSLGLALGGMGAYDGSRTVNPANFTNWEFDIKWDPTSTINITNHLTGGDPNGFGLGVANPGWGQNWIPNPNNPGVNDIINDGQWHHVKIPLNPAWSAVPGVIFKKYMGYNAANEGTTSKFWIDNIFFGTNAHPVLPKPTISFKPAVQGLTLVAAQPGSQYQRNGVRSVPADTHQWYGNPDPVTYSVTIGEFPSGANYAGFQGHIFLSTDGGTTEPDWNNSSVIFVQFQQTAGGQGVCNFRFKTNSPNSNGVGSSGFFGTGYIMQMIAPSIRGTWNVTFTNNSHITVTGPGGTGTNFDMGADAAAFFQTLTPSMATYFGCQPNNPDNIGQRMTVTRIRITDGSTTVVDDTFPVEDSVNEADPTLWIQELDAPATNAIKVVNQNSIWMDWNKPDTYLSDAQVSLNVNSGYTNVGLPLIDLGQRRSLYLGTNYLVNFPNDVFFRLYSTNLPP